MNMISRGLCELEPCKLAAVFIFVPAPSFAPSTQLTAMGGVSRVNLARVELVRFSQLGVGLASFPGPGF